ncbi:hypothetical protein KAU37_07165, partial [Candidatus Bipolaricaulota bacterium]|nr:hypothetical protein [Candidatus Bipolaricaulota bacterium]
VTGRTLNFTEKTMMRSNPSQKLGIETPTRADTVLTLSRKEYLFTDEITPTGMAIINDIIMDKRVNSNVAGRRVPINFITGARWMIDRPKSP